MSVSPRLIRKIACEQYMTFSLRYNSTTTTVLFNLWTHQSSTLVPSLLPIFSRRCQKSAGLINVRWAKMWHHNLTWSANNYLSQLKVEGQKWNFDKITVVLSVINFFSLLTNFCVKNNYYMTWREITKFMLKLIIQT